MKKIAIIGAGDLGQLIAQNVFTIGESVAGFYDDFANNEDALFNIPILGKIEDVLEDYKSERFTHLVLAIGYKHMDFRAQLYEHLSQSIPFCNIIHPSAVIAKSVTLGQGVVIFANTTIDFGAQISDNVLINTSVNVSHDSKIGINTFIGPSASIAGFVSVGANCFIGINSTIIDNIRLCDRTQTGGGAVLIESTSLSGLYVGNPARHVPKG